jgi:hypothetical protein
MNQSLELLSHPEIAACGLCPRPVNGIKPICRCKATGGQVNFGKLVYQNWWQYQKALTPANAREIFGELATVDNAGELIESYQDGIRHICNCIQCGLFMITDFDGALANLETSTEARDRGVYVGTMAMRNMLAAKYPELL